MNCSKRNETKYCVVWTRVSTKYQEENGGSLDYQRTLCEEYAKQNDLIIKGYYGGQHESAKTPGVLIREMISRVKKDPTIKFILISEFDRFSRNSGQAINIINDLTNCGVVVIACKTGQDTRDKNGFLMASIGLALAQWDNSNRVDKFISGRRDCLLKGVWVEPAPMGYYKEGKSKNTMCRLNETGRLIRQAFLWKIEGYSNGDIIDKLESRGLKLSHQTLHKILTNPFYAGKVKHKLIDNQMVDGVHEPAVTYTQFLKVQDILSGRTGKYKHRSDVPTGPLKKHVFCDKDKTPMTFYTKKKNGKEYGYYKCNTKGCSTNISSKKLHDGYTSMLSEYDLSPNLIKIVERAVRQLLTEGNKEVTDNVTQLRKRLTEVEKQINDTKLRYGIGKIDDDIFQVTIEELQNRKGRLLVELEKCENTLSNSDNEVSEIVATCCHLSTLWNDSNLETKIKVQQLVFPNGIFWNHENNRYRTPDKSPIFNIIDRISRDYIQRTEVDFTTSVPLCGRRESNPYASRHQILSLACLPISTRPRFGTANVVQNIVFTNFRNRIRDGY